MIEFRSLLESLNREDVAFVIIGEIAATLHGSAPSDRTPDNLERLVTAG